MVALLASTFVVRETGPADAPRPRLLDRVREALRARHYSRRTEHAYVAWIRKRHPAEMGAPEITRFLTWLAVHGKVAASTQNQALGALLFLYREVLELEVPWLDGLRCRNSPHSAAWTIGPRRPDGGGDSGRCVTAPGRSTRALHGSKPLDLPCYTVPPNTC